ncbi:FBD-associated F-box protein At5g22730 [Linum perenne]
MLSNLSESIVHHILLFIDEKSLIRTSALSKQWKCTWIQGSTLRFKSSRFRSYSSFETYILKVMSLRSSTNLHELSVIAYCQSNQVDYIIIIYVVKYVFSRDVQHLEVCLENRVYPMLLSLRKMFDGQRRGDRFALMLRNCNRSN